MGALLMQKLLYNSKLIVMKRIISTFLLIPILTFSQNYSLDTTFGSNGINYTANASECVKSIFATDNKILTTGFILSNNFDLVTHTVVVKLNSNGLADTTFGNNGLIQTNVDYKDTPHGIATQPNGKILVAGSFTIESPSTGIFPRNPYVIRYNTDGSLDTTFGANGILKIFNFNTVTSTNAYSIVPLSNGKIFVSISGNSSNLNSALIRLNEDGTFDTSFADNGILRFDTNSYRFSIIDIIKTDDNKILLCGADRTISNNFKSSVIKLNLDGSYDTTFADNGKLVLDIFTATSASNYEYFKDLKKCPDGTFIAGGWLSNNNSIIKFNSFGQLITSFGTNGLLQNFYYNNNNSQVLYGDLDIQSDNKIIVGGTMSNDGMIPIIKITRLYQNGSLDLTFNSTGDILVDVTPSNDNLKTVNVDFQNSIIMSGWSQYNGDSAIVHSKIVPNNLSVNDFRSNFTIYPNPISDQINFSDTIALKLVQIYNVNGVLLSEYKNPGVVNFLKVELNTGFYICKIENSNGEQKIFKLIKK